MRHGRLERMDVCCDRVRMYRIRRLDTGFSFRFWEGSILLFFCGRFVVSDSLSSTLDNLAAQQHKQAEHYTKSPSVTTKPSPRLLHRLTTITAQQNVSHNDLPHRTNLHLKIHSTLPSAPPPRKHEHADHTTLRKERNTQHVRHTHNGSAEMGR